jgi:uncharacterized LabA/DUF88 family protein
LNTNPQDSDTERPDGPKRTVVLIDYQNMYREARRAFGWENAPGHLGNLKPIALGRILTQAQDRELVQVRVYTGMPSLKREKKGNAIMQRRLAAWVSDYPKCVEVFPRPMQYIGNSREGKEKGIDVELSIDLVSLAMDDEFDVAVVASADTDLQPPIEFVLDRYPGKLIETAAFAPLPECEGIASQPLDVKGGRAHRKHRIEKKVFDKAVADTRNFVIATTSPDSMVEKSRWTKISERFSSAR